MQWFIDSLRHHPELGLFLTLAAGYYLGRLRFGSFQLGNVVGVLVAGILVGQLGIKVAAELKNTFFLLFLFSIGFKTGPQFFRGLRSTGLQQAGLTLFFAACGLTTAWAVAKLLGFDAGTGSGLLAGALTESAALGTAGDAIAKLAVSPELRDQLETNGTVAFAVTYLVGMIVVTWLLARLGPALMRVDIAKACAELEATLGVARDESGVVSAYFEFIMRAYFVPAALEGRSVRELEQSFGDARVFVERMKRDGRIFDVHPHITLHRGDCIVLSGRRSVLVGAGNPLSASEAEDSELLDIPTVGVDIIVTAKTAVGQPIQALAQHVSTRGVFLRKLVRGGQELPFGLLTTLDRGDVMTVSGAKQHIERIAGDLGYAQWPDEKTDIALVASAIFIGGMIGLPALMFGQLEVGLSMFVGALLGGLVFGWLRSIAPRGGHVPESSLWLFDSIGLAGFLAVVGIDAGPNFVRGVTESGVELVLASVVVCALPHIVTILVGRYVFRMHPGIVLGVCAGAGTSAPGLAAVQERANSKVPALAYGVSYALGNVLLALWGSVIVVLLGAPR
jgi:putative transport protein